MALPSHVSRLASTCSETATLLQTNVIRTTLVSVINPTRKREIPVFSNNYNKFHSIWMVLKPESSILRLLRSLFVTDNIFIPHLLEEPTDIVV